MIRTLVTDELRRLGSWFGALTGIALLVVGLFVILAVVAAQIGGGILSVIAMVLSMITAALYCAATFLLPAVFFYRSCYGSSAYLTGSIALRGRTIALIKFAVGAAISVLGLVVGCGLALLVGLAWFASQGFTWAQIGEVMKRGLEVLASTPTWVVAGGIFLALLCTLATLSTYYFAVAIGSEAWISKLGLAGPVLTWHVAYFVMQICGFLGLLLPIYLVWPEGVVQLHFEWIDVFAEAAEQVLPLGVLLTQILVGMLALPLAVRSYDRRLDLS